MKKRILIFGDSNTWGYMPGQGTRYDENTRWPKVAQKILGDDYELIEDAISGRTTFFTDDLNIDKNGRDALPFSINAHMPLDMVIFHLGANDLKFVSADISSRGLANLMKLTRAADDAFPGAGNQTHYPNGLKMMVISPIHIHPDMAKKFPESRLVHGYEQSLLFAEKQRLVAEEMGAYFMDSAEYGQPSPIDCLHMGPESHIAIGQAVAQKIKEIFE